MDNNHHQQNYMYNNRERLSRQALLRDPQSSNYGRQDSLTVCASLQDADRTNDSKMMEFMETSMNLDDYLPILQGIQGMEDVPSDAVYLDDNEMYKIGLLHDQPNHFENQMDTQQHPYEPFSHNEDIVPEYQQQAMHDSEMSSRSSSVMYAPVPNSSEMKPVKREVVHEYDDVDEQSTSASCLRRRVRDASIELEKFTPTTKARKYNLKPVEEKLDPGYKLKRARNNDAVRKSRSKQKEAQTQREKELKDLRDDNIRLATKLAHAEKTIKEQSDLIKRLSGGQVKY